MYEGCCPSTQDRHFWASPILTTVWLSSVARASYATATASATMPTAVMPHDGVVSRPVFYLCHVQMVRALSNLVALWIKNAAGPTNREREDFLMNSSRCICRYRLFLPYPAAFQIRSFFCFRNSLSLLYRSKHCLYYDITMHQYQVLVPPSHDILPLCLACCA